MSFLTNREGSLSVFRIGILVAVLGGLFIVGGFLLAQLDVIRRQSPLNIDVPPGAVLSEERDTSSTSKQLIYQVEGGDAQAIADFYQAELDEHLGNSPNDPGKELCVRQPLQGSFSATEGYEPGNGRVPFFHRCVFEDSIAGGLGTGGAIRFTTVLIQPGVRDDTAEPPTDFTGTVFIIHDQVWES